MSEQRTGVGKGRDIALIAAIVAALQGGQLVYSSTEYMSRADVTDLVAKQSPYIEDRGRILQVVDGYPEQVKELADALGSLRIELALLNARLGEILAAGERRRK